MRLRDSEKDDGIESIALEFLSHHRPAPIKAVAAER